MVQFAQRILFENPIWAVVVWVPVQIALLVVWSRCRTGRSVRIVWIGFASLPLLLVVQSLVETRREGVIAFCHRLADYAEHGEAAAIEAAIAPEFRVHRRYQREEFLEHLRRTLATARFERIRLHRFRVGPLDGPAVRITFDASAIVSGQETGRRRARVRWIVSLRREGDDWLVTRAEPQPSHASPIGHLEELFR
jgi:hypothetical protein